MQQRDKHNPMKTNPWRKSLRANANAQPPGRAAGSLEGIQLANASRILLLPVKGHAFFSRHNPGSIRPMRSSCLTMGVFY